MKKTASETNSLLDFKSYLEHSKIFIETGTCYGRSVQLALDAGYERIKSVEACDEYFKSAFRTFEQNPKVHLFFGKSIEHLPTMLQDVNGPAVLWLDAHVSENKEQVEDWKSKGEESDFHQHTALKKELEIVLAHRNDHVILIDDQNGPNADNEVYIDMISKANPEYKFYWVDEQMGDTFYKNKILLAII